MRIIKPIAAALVTVALTLAAGVVAPLVAGAVPIVVRHDVSATAAPP